MNKTLPSRKSIRLKNYDYSQPGYYYVTICTQNRGCILGEIIDGNMVLNDIGKMINKWLGKIPQRFDNIQLDECVVMPNHIHLIIVIIDNENGRTHGSIGRTHGSAPTYVSSKNSYFDDQQPSPHTVGVDQCVDPNVRVNRHVYPALSKIIQWFKSMTTNEYIKNVIQNDWEPFEKRIWQRNYWEHVIRTGPNLNKIRKYISTNPIMWYRDRNNPTMNDQKTLTNRYHLYS